MRDEVAMVVKFISQSMIKDRLPTDVVGRLCEKLTRLLYIKYTNHWHPRNPLAGNGYRAIACSAGKLDMLLSKALRHTGVSLQTAGKILPQDFTIWCDPGDVSVRLGEEGSVWSLKFESAAPTSMASVAFVSPAKSGAHRPSPMAITPMKPMPPMAITPVKRAPMAITPTKSPWPGSRQHRGPHPHSGWSRQSSGSLKEISNWC